ncbi:MAG: DUF3536 domain-containing protein [Candidatus Omnitrophica bacterium]|nr:DUF3536 domain-containing protein [Candidatus Omnitrophota bacterium]
MNKYICIHGHFYQPPRENPWLETIEIQDSAYPYNDWNERITAECYLQNAESRIQDHEGFIVDIVNNYSKMSFNFGPTLLSWMEKFAPDVYYAILEADRQSLKRFNGHGAALAQVYNHMIMPLANIKDKKTQIIWGIKDFESRFDRKPEGMWLAETAVDIETLELLAAHDIKYTILSPYQARSFRSIGTEEWIDVSNARIDPKRPYYCHLPSGFKIVLFFYDGPISQEVAFGDLTKDGSAFAHRLMSNFPDHTDEAVIVHIATDGETYGHHQKFGNMALAYMLNFIEGHSDFQLTVYGDFLEKYSPQHEVQIIENSSWSCAHGIERWRSDCGCHVGGGPEWNQRWRQPLREAMDWLRDELAYIYEDEISPLTKQPWKLRDDYIRIILDRDIKTIQSFFKKHIKKNLSEKDYNKILNLLEMQRHALFMYTSCGWFFDDISGIETVQIIQYAARAIQIAKDIKGIDLEKGYLKILYKAKSNVSDKKNAKEIYLQQVKPSIIDLIDVGAYFAIALLFEDLPDVAKSYAYTVYKERFDQDKEGFRKLLQGHLRIVSNVTLEEQKLDFAVLHQGGHQVVIGVQSQGNGRSLVRAQKDIMHAFKKEKFDKVQAQIKECFGENHYSLWDLLKNERSKALKNIFEETLQTIEDDARKIYDLFFPLTKVKKDMRVQLPKSLVMIMEFILNRDLCELLESDRINLKHLDEVVSEIKRFSFMRDKETICVVSSEAINQKMIQCQNDPMNVRQMIDLARILNILQQLQLTIDLWKAQNIFFKIGQKHFQPQLEQSDGHDNNAKQWIEAYNALGDCLDAKIRV